MKTFAITMELMARVALYMTVTTLSLKHMLKGAKSAGAGTGTQRR